MTLNLYTYCFNNPGIYVDQSGNFPFLIVTGLIGAVVGGVVGGVTSYIQTGEVSLKSVAAGAAIGGGIGLTGGAATAYITTGSFVASTGAVASGAAAMYASASASASAIVIKGVNDLWQKGAVVRGNIIEKFLGGMCNNFPTIDKFVNGAKGIASSITSIKSIDLFAKSYQTKNAIYNTVMKYANSLSGFTDKTWGGITVNVSESTKRILELAIPANAGSSQMDQVYRAVTDALSKYGVDIVIKVFQ